MKKHCYMNDYLSLFYNNKLLYSILYSYLDTNSLYSIIFVNKQFYKKKKFIYNLILGKCVYYAMELNKFEYMIVFYYNKIYNKPHYESNKEFLIDFCYYNKNYELSVLYKNEKLCKKFDKIRRYKLKYEITRI